MYLVFRGSCHGGIFVTCRCAVYRVFFSSRACSIFSGSFSMLVLNENKYALYKSSLIYSVREVHSTIPDVGKLCRKEGLNCLIFFVTCQECL